MESATKPKQDKKQTCLRGERPRFISVTESGFRLEAYQIRIKMDRVRGTPPERRKLNKLHM